MTPVASRHDSQAARRRGAKGAGALETVVVVASMIAIVLFMMIDIVRTAPPDAPVVEATFDVAPAVEESDVPGPADRRPEPDDGHAAINRPSPAVP